MATVYLIHFSEKLDNRVHHYLGYTCAESVTARVERHRRGDGAKILNECNKRAIKYFVVRTWNSMSATEARLFERKLKRQRNHPRLCPLCNEHNYKNHGKEKPNGTSFESE